MKLKKDGTPDKRIKTTVSQGQLKYLQALYDSNGECSDVWKNCNVSRQAGAEYVETLKRKGYIEKRPYGRDVIFTKKALDIVK